MNTITTEKDTIELLEAIDVATELMIKNISENNSFAGMLLEVDIDEAESVANNTRKQIEAAQILTEFGLEISEN